MNGLILIQKEDEVKQTIAYGEKYKSAHQIFGKDRFC